MSMHMKASQMFYRFLAGATVAVLAMLSPAGGETSPTPIRASPSLVYGKLPLAFEANMGQTDARVLFLSRRRGMTTFFTDSETVMAPIRGEAAVRMKLEGAGRAKRVIGLEKLPGISNYFIGSDPAKWRTNVPHYARIQYEGVYKGIDLVWYSNEGRLEYDFVAAAGADPKQIKMSYVGADSMEVEPGGDLELRTAQGVVRQQKPRVHQEVDGKQVEIKAKYAVVARNQVSFELDGYDRKRQLRIDPIVVAYSTYLGGSGGSIAVDAEGSAYVTGSTGSIDFPTEAAYQGTSAGRTSDAFVAKLTPAGDALVYSTYLGGNGSDVAKGIVVDSAGSAYITGQTTSTDFPTQSPFQGTYQGGRFYNFGDAFVTKLAPGGNALVYSTYLGGDGSDSGNAIAVDRAGSAYVTGDTGSFNFPMQSPYQGRIHSSACGLSCQTTDAFVTKLSPAGNSLVYSTYLGGFRFEQGSAIAVDEAGSAYVTGYTSSFDFPTKSAYQPVYRSGECCSAFVTKLTPAGDELSYSTFLGGFGMDLGYGIAVDGSGSAYVTGRVTSEDFPLQSAIQTKYAGAWDAFAAKLSPTGRELVYSTYLGGSGRDYGVGIAVDYAGSAYVTGFTDSIDFPGGLGYPFTLQESISHAFLTKLNPAGDALIYSIYFGGNGRDGAGGIAVDGSYDVFAIKLTGFIDWRWKPRYLFQSICPYDILWSGMSMSTTLSVTLPPEQFERAERLAERENRTLSDVVGEALSKYELMQDVNIDWALLTALRAVQQSAKRAGLDTMTEEEIDDEVTAYRREKDSIKSQSLR